EWANVGHIGVHIETATGFKSADVSGRLTSHHVQGGVRDLLLNAGQHLGAEPSDAIDVWAVEEGAGEHEPGSRGDGLRNEAGGIHSVRNDTDARARQGGHVVIGWGDDEIE